MSAATNLEAMAEVCEGVTSSVHLYADHKDQLARDIRAVLAENTQMREALTRITKINWGWDGDCGAKAIAENALP